MLKEHATHAKSGDFKVWPGIIEIDECMKQGRFHVDRRLSDWFREYEDYHVADGKIVKVRDHLMDATRVAWMMIRRKGQAGPLGPGGTGRRHELLMNRPTRKPLTDPWTNRPIGGAPDQSKWGF